MARWSYQAPIARDPGLEARIAEDLDALEPYLIYADWLQERGDPRGELITMQILMETADPRGLAALRERLPHRDRGPHVRQRQCLPADDRHRALDQLPALPRLSRGHDHHQQGDAADQTAGVHQNACPSERWKTVPRSRAPPASV